VECSSAFGNLSLFWNGREKGGDWWFGEGFRRSWDCSRWVEPIVSRSRGLV